MDNQTDKPSLDDLYNNYSQQQKPSLNDLYNSYSSQSSNPQQMAQAASQMPNGEQPQSGIMSSPFIWNGHSLMPNPYAKNSQNQSGDIQGQVVQQQALIPGKTQEKTEENQAINQIGAARQIAEEQTNLDAFTGGLREAAKDIGRAHIQGMAGGWAQNLYGQAAIHGFAPWSNKSGQKAYAAFESLKSAMIPQLNSIYSSQYGGRDPSTKIIASLLELGAKELLAPDKTIDANEGQIQASLGRFTTKMMGSLNYLKNNYTAQQLAEAFKKDPSLLNKYAEDAFKNSTPYTFSANALNGMQDRYNTIVQPLEAARRGLATYDMPQEDGSVRAALVPAKEAYDFEKRNKL